MAIITVEEGGTYASLQAGITAASAGDTINITGAWTADDTTQAVVNKDNITIQIAKTDAAYHGGLYDTTNTHYRLVVNTASNGGHCIIISNVGCLVDGLAIRQDGSTNSAEGIRNDYAGVATASNCIICTYNDVFEQDGFNGQPNGAIINATNCIIYGFNRSCLRLNGTSGRIAASSCTLYPLATQSGGNGGCVAISQSTSSIQVHLFNTLMALDTTAHIDAACIKSASGSGTIFTFHYCSVDDTTISTADADKIGNLNVYSFTDSTAPGAGNYIILNDITGVTTYDFRLQDSTDNDALDVHDVQDSTDAALNTLSIPSVDIRNVDRLTPFTLGASKVGSNAAVVTTHTLAFSEEQTSTNSDFTAGMSIDVFRAATPSTREVGVLAVITLGNATYVQYNVTYENETPEAGDVVKVSYDSTAGDINSTGIARTGTAQAGAATTITLDAGASATDDAYNLMTVVIDSGTGNGQSKSISDYVGSTKVATVSTWTTNPDNTSVFTVHTGNVGQALASFTDDTNMTIC